MLSIVSAGMSLNNDDVNNISTVFLQLFFITAAPCFLVAVATDLLVILYYT